VACGPAPRGPHDRSPPPTSQAGGARWTNDGAGVAAARIDATYMLSGANQVAGGRRSAAVRGGHDGGFLSGARQIEIGFGREGRRRGCQLYTGEDL